MNVTLHLTNNCNMRCSYCYIPKNDIRNMSSDIAFKAVDLIVKNTPPDNSMGIVFYGGEPLLQKELIHEVVNYSRNKYPDRSFYFKMTTNSLLLEEEFIDFSKKNGIFISISLDGVKESHDKFRKDTLGHGTHDRVVEKSKLILKKLPYTPVMMTINPETTLFFRDSVEFIYNLGFKYIICTLNYSAGWTDADLTNLKRQFEKLSKLYYDLTIKETKFYFSPFDVKICSYINNEKYCKERCELGKKLISVTQDGKIFPCVQFAGDDNFMIGHVDSGIDYNKQNYLFSLNEKEKYECANCEIKNRCNHSCGCINKITTGFIDKASPLQCEYERLLTPIADRLAEKLYKKRSAMFIHKHYNDLYPVISIIEDHRLNKK